MQNILIRRIESAENIEEAIELFAHVIPRHWPNTTQEARSWIYEEFHHTQAIVLGAYTEKHTTLIGVCALVPFCFVWQHLDRTEQKLLSENVHMISPTINVPDEMIHWGGLAVLEEYEGTGLAQLLNREAERCVRFLQMRFIIAQTGRASAQYRLIRGLPYARKCGYKELVPRASLFYPSPNDLEKVWLWKRIT